ncbi:MAG: 3-isopropylmalate dehydrogenase [Thermodesulfobacteriota bacterium]|nr:3-isopropylmalate dehydrogenase [Thermodesulfobacteriota bacterium]
MSYKIALYPGDGVGPEVVREAKKVLDACSMEIEYTTFDWSTALYAGTGRCAPETFLDQLKPFDAILFGALGNAENAPDHVAVQPLLDMRKGFDQYVNIRPALLYPGVESPLKAVKPYDIDMVVIRENTEGEYTSMGGRHYVGTPNETAMQINYFTRMGTERIIRYAFETAQKRPKKHLTSITKSNVLKYSMVFWDSIFNEIAEEYPEVNSDSMLVDAAAMNLVRSPEIFDVIVASNLFGDILTDIASITIGGMGFAGSANINPERIFPSMFEPVHGSAPDIAGKNMANPVAAILSAAMMCDFLGEKTIGSKIRDALCDHLKEDRIKTPDRGGKDSTSQVGNDIAKRL